MGRPQDPHRPFFPFGNPFKMMLPKGSHLPPRLLGLLNAFEETLAERLQKLMPRDKHNVLSLSWMKLAMELLSETHNDIKTLVTDLDLPLCDWDEKWVDAYLDNSVKLLDICIAFNSEIARLDKSRLFLKCASCDLKSNSPTRLVRARSSLDRWTHHLGSKNPRVESCRAVLESLAETFDLPKVKNSAKRKVLARAMHGVKVETVFVCGALCAAFSGSSEMLVDLKVAPDAHLWEKAFENLQTAVHGEIRGAFSSERAAALEEVETVEGGMERVYSLLRDGEKPGEADVSELETRVGRFSQALDALAKEVDGFFRVVLGGRDALLCNMRSRGTALDQVVEGRKSRLLDDSSP